MNNGEGSGNPGTFCYSFPLPERKAKQVRGLLKDCETILRGNLNLTGGVTAESGSMPAVPAADAKPDPWIYPVFPLHRLEPGKNAEFSPLRRGVIVGTMRMGYGHYRTALAIASAAAARGIIPYLFDPGWFSAEIYRTLAGLDRWYKLGSGLADIFPLFDRLFWERGTGKTFKNLGSMVQVYRAAKVLLPAFLSLQDDMPFIGTHSWLSQAASLRGIKPTANAVQDNWSQGFFLSQPGLQCIQGPSAYTAYRLTLGMGAAGREPPPMPANSLRLTGHFTDQNLLNNLDEDCKSRVRRRKAGMPKRFLFSMGGAGAQRRLLESVINSLLPFVERGRAVLVINCGDHRQAWRGIERCLSGSAVDPVLHEKWEETLSLFGAGRSLSSSLEDLKGIHVFLSEEILPAVYTTNLFIRWCDFLITKPSELAFYPVPKLNLKRLGFHEAFNAYRSAELGDGTPELTTQNQIGKAIAAVMEGDDLLYLMIDNILSNRQAGAYNGAQSLLDLLI